MKKQLAAVCIGIIALWSCTNETTSDTCGDGVIDIGEDCDGNELGTFGSCSAYGLYGGAVTCSSNCTIDTSGCGDEGSCGDGLVQFVYGEQCDGANLNGYTCIALGYEGGELGCNSDCTFDRGGCVGETLCGDGLVQEGEECDGDDLAGNTCEALGGYAGSTFCRFDCSLNLSECAYCGNDVIETAFGEECDTNQLLSCHALREGFGMPGCDDTCHFERDQCHPAQIIGSMGYDLPFDAVVMDGNLYISGVTVGGWGGMIGPSNHQFLARINTLGEIDWVKSLESSVGGYPPHGVEKTSDDGIIFAGPIVPESAISGAYLRKFRADGTEVWAKSFTKSQDPKYRWSFLVDTEDTIWWGKLAVNTFEIDHLSADGTFIESFTLPANGVVSITQIHEDTAGNLLIIGETSGGIGAVNYTDPGTCGLNNNEMCSAPFMVSMTRSGTVNWVVIHDPNGAVSLTGARGVIAGDEIVLCGNTSGAFDGEQFQGNQDVYCLWYDLTGNHLDTRIYGSTSANTFGGLFLSADGEVILAASSRVDMWGQTITENGSYDIFLTTLSATGEQLSSTVIGSDGEDQPTLLAPRDNHEEFYILGTSLGTWGDQLNQGNEDMLIYYMTTDDI